MNSRVISDFSLLSQTCWFLVFPRIWYCFLCRYFRSNCMPFQWLRFTLIKFKLFDQVPNAFDLEVDCTRSPGLQVEVLEPKHNSGKGSVSWLILITSEPDKSQDLLNTLLCGARSGDGKVLFFMFYKKGQKIWSAVYHSFVSEKEESRKRHFKLG